VAPSAMMAVSIRLSLWAFGNNWQQQKETINAALSMLIFI
jgi:hypothetical protein